MWRIMGWAFNERFNFMNKLCRDTNLSQHVTTKSMAEFIAEGGIVSLPALAKVALGIF